MSNGDAELVEEADVSDGVKELRDRIAFTLSIYPKVSMSMLQVALGTGLSPTLWHPILNRMIEDGIVNKAQISRSTPKGRSQTYTIISLS